MPRAVRWLPLLVLVVATAACVGGAGTKEGTAPPQTQGNQPASAPVCPPAWRAGWQRLADRIHAPVYCPGWIPAPLTGEIGGQWNSTDSVKSDRSYLIGFIYFQRDVGEVHVNFRGYPGRTVIPACNGKPCFNDPVAHKRIDGLDVEAYAVNRGADTWHVLYAWKANGSLYAVSQHVVPDLGVSYARVSANLDRMVRALVRIDPQQS